jgi:hypothetical protein
MYVPMFMCVCVFARYTSIWSLSLLDSTGAASAQHQ